MGDVACANILVSREMRQNTMKVSGRGRGAFWLNPTISSPSSVPREGANGGAGLPTGGDLARARGAAMCRKWRVENEEKQNGGWKPRRREKNEKCGINGKRAGGCRDGGPEDGGRGQAVRTAASGLRAEVAASCFCCRREWCSFPAPFPSLFLRAPPAFALPFDLPAPLLRAHWPPASASRHSSPHDFLSPLQFAGEKAGNFFCLLICS